MQFKNVFLLNDVSHIKVCTFDFTLLLVVFESLNCDVCSEVNPATISSLHAHSGELKTSLLKKEEGSETPARPPAASSVCISVTERVQKFTQPLRHLQLSVNEQQATECSHVPARKPTAPLWCKVHSLFLQHSLTGHIRASVLYPRLSVSP